jgi:hypothetical protein
MKVIERDPNGSPRIILATREEWNLNCRDAVFWNR